MQGKTSKGPEPFDIIMVWSHLAPGILHNFKALNESPFNDKIYDGQLRKKKTLDLHCHVVLGKLTFQPLKVNSI